LALVLPFAACDNDSGGGGGGDGDATVTDGGSTSDASGLPDGSTVTDGGGTTADAGDAGWQSEECYVTQCQEQQYLCGDCLDNDGDGLIDSQDPDCLGPCDNNEGGFNTQIPGGNAQPCMADCYFDKDSGAGNDDCFWDQRCDPLQPEAVQTCNYNVTCASCQCSDWESSQSSTCLDVCLPLVPNGCDCFGCCELDADAGTYGFIGSPGCSPDNLSACDPCTPVMSCINECGPCELCLGRTELPPECGTEQTCPSGQQLCGQPGDDPCPEGTYCITGCCVPVVQ
jgi:hypothetical protein